MNLITLRLYIQPKIENREMPGLRLNIPFQMWAFFYNSCAIGPHNSFLLLLAAPLRKPVCHRGPCQWEKFYHENSLHGWNFLGNQLV